MAGGRELSTGWLTPDCHRFFSALPSWPALKGQIFIL
jgi:hypothetical protein